MNFSIHRKMSEKFKLNKFSKKKLMKNEWISQWMKEQKRQYKKIAWEWYVARCWATRNVNPCLIDRNRTRITLSKKHKEDQKQIKKKQMSEKTKRKSNMRRKWKGNVRLLLPLHHNQHVQWQIQIRSRMQLVLSIHQSTVDLVWMC
jgi:hypothetical protein